MLDTRGTREHERVQTRLEARVRLLARSPRGADPTARREAAHQSLPSRRTDERAHDDPEAATAKTPRRVTGGHAMPRIASRSDLDALLDLNRDYIRSVQTSDVRR